MARKKLKTLSKNYRLLQTSWVVQGKLFFEHSTLHGVRYIAENGRPFIERFMWFSCVSIGTIATSVIIFNLWEKFQTNPTITGLDTDFHNWDVPFPAITICPHVPTSQEKIEAYIQENFGRNETTKEEIEFYMRLAQLSYQTWKHFYNNFSQQNHIKPDTDLKVLVFKERKTLPEFNMQYIQETDLKWSMKFKVKTMDSYFPIYILNSDEVAGIDTQPQHIWDFRMESIMFSVKQTYTTLDTKQLSIKQRHCAFPDEIKLEAEIYSYTACTRECRINTAMKLCKCVPFFYPTIGGIYPHCGIGEFNCIAKHLKEIESVEGCACYLGCSNTVYEIEKLDAVGADHDNALDCKFVSWPMVRYKREVLFGWVDLLVSFGGIAGLFLGFSLLSGVEILYYFTIRACCMVIRERDDLQKIQYREASEPLLEYDLSLVPYFISKPLPGNGINEVAKKFRYSDFKEKSSRKVTPANNTIHLKKTSDIVIPPFGIEFMN